MGDGAHILVVDDDDRLRGLLRRYLTDHGFAVTAVGDAATARSQLAAMAFDLLVVDVMMPGEDGLSLTRTVRGAGAVPILLLTAHGEPEDRIAGLEAGADDYLAKPFEPRELLLRIGSILRRTRQLEAEPDRAGPVMFGGFRFDQDRGELWLGANRVHLTGAEVGLLRALARVPGDAVSREALAHELDLDADPRAIDVHVSRLRRKVEPDPRQPRHLQTVRGKGYMLLPD